jgi:hypothetical protein
METNLSMPLQYNKITDLDISKLILCLESIKSKYGDLPVWIMTVNENDQKEIKELTHISCFEKDGLSVVCLLSENPESILFIKSK